jgi:hypothetical protein
VGYKSKFNLISASVFIIIYTNKFKKSYKRFTEKAPML